MGREHGRGHGHGHGRVGMGVSEPAARLIQTAPHRHAHLAEIRCVTINKTDLLHVRELLEAALLGLHLKQPFIVGRQRLIPSFHLGLHVAFEVEAAEQEDDKEAEEDERRGSQRPHGPRAPTCCSYPARGRDQQHHEQPADAGR